MAIVTASRQMTEARREAGRAHESQLRYRLALAAIDIAINRLEEMNLEGRGGARPDGAARQAIERALEMVPLRTPDRPGWGTVQRALDGLFDVQEAMQIEHRLELRRANLTLEWRATRVEAT